MEEEVGKSDKSKGLRLLTYFWTLRIGDAKDSREVRETSIV